MGVSVPRDHGPGPCRLNRAMNKQPIGYLVRWLQCGCNHDGQQEHFGARNLTGDDQELSYEECKRARDWIRTAGVEDVDSLFAAEPGDGEEPLPRARARGSWQA